MKGHRLPLALGLFMAATLPSQARSTFETSADNGGGSNELPAYLQCVPYAREMTGVQLYGDAHTWWAQAEGRYRRGHRPEPGAVMTLQPYGNSTLGHVAAVSKVVDARTVLIDHANWSERGRIERNVQAVDVSPANDWSEVRIWYGPSQKLGANRWPVAGFIYGDRPATSAAGSGTSVTKAAVVASGTARSAPRPARVSVTRKSSDPIGDIIAGKHR